MRRSRSATDRQPNQRSRALSRLFPLREAPSMTTLDRSELLNFTGSETVYQHHFRRLNYTEGIKHVAARYGAYWLIDAIASYQGPKLDQQCDWMQVWSLA